MDALPPQNLSNAADVPPPPPVPTTPVAPPPPPPPAGPTIVASKKGFHIPSLSPKAKIIATIVSVIILVAGGVTGYFLTQQKQLFENKAGWAGGIDDQLCVTQAHYDQCRSQLGDNFQIWLGSYRCAPGSSGPCSENGFYQSQNAQVGDCVGFQKNACPADLQVDIGCTNGTNSIPLVDFLSYDWAQCTQPEDTPTPVTSVAPKACGETCSVNTECSSDLSCQDPGGGNKICWGGRCETTTVTPTTSTLNQITLSGRTYCVESSGTKRNIANIPIKRNNVGMTGIVSNSSGIWTAVLDKPTWENSSIRPNGTSAGFPDASATDDYTKRNNGIACEDSNVEGVSFNAGNASIKETGGCARAAIPANAVNFNLGKCPITTTPTVPVTPTTPPGAITLSGRTYCVEANGVTQRAIPNIPIRMINGANSAIVGISNINGDWAAARTAANWIGALRPDGLPAFPDASATDDYTKRNNGITCADSNIEGISFVTNMTAIRETGGCARTAIPANAVNFNLGKCPLTITPTLPITPTVPVTPQCQQITILRDNQPISAAQIQLGDQLTFRGCASTTVPNIIFTLTIGGVDQAPVTRSTNATSCADYPVTIQQATSYTVRFTPSTN